MANFSNGGVDTFDPANDYIGIRLQQGVPLLDRDWNELEDIRRNIERMLGRHYIGDGAPDTLGFRVRALDPPAANDVVIEAGRCMVDGLDLSNRTPVAFSEQGEGVTLPAPGAGDQVLVLYLEPRLDRVGSDAIPALGNPQDLGIETCVRDRLSWSVQAVEHPAVPPPGTYPIATISRPADIERVEDEHIVDLRRSEMSVAANLERGRRLALELEELRDRVTRAQERIEEMQTDLDRLFWQVTVTPSTRQALSGGRVKITVRVTNRRGEPIRGATVSISTDWGQVTLPSSVTNAVGEVTADLVGVRNDVFMRPDDIAQLERINTKVASAMVRDAAPAGGDDLRPIEYQRLRFDPSDLELISRYSPTAALTDLTNELPNRAEIQIPKGRTATLTVHAKESQYESVVKATGNVQIRFGEWVRDWARTKVWEMTESLHIGARVGDILRQGVNPDQTFDHDRVIGTLLPSAMQQIGDDTTRAMKSSVFGDAGLADTGMRGAGKLGQVLAEEVTAAVGAKAQQVVVAQMASLVASNVVPAAAAAEAERQLTQGSAQLVAGLAQTKKQLFTRVEG